MKATTNTKVAVAEATAVIADDDGRVELKETEKIVRATYPFHFSFCSPECRRSDLKVEKQMSDLRCEYADACLSGNSLRF